MRVYKFLDAHFGLKTLYEQRLKISKIDDLNDPFELLPFDLTDRPNVGRHAKREKCSRRHRVCCVLVPLGATQ